MNLANVYIATVIATNNIENPLRNTTMLQRKMGKGPKHTLKTDSP
jgi:hypothetical protein